MSNMESVAKKADIPVGSGKTVQIDGKPVAIFNVEGSFYAIDDTCLHRGGALGEGTLEGSIVTCPRHGWQYDVKTGVNTTNPEVKIKAYEVKIDGEDVLVSLG